MAVVSLILTQEVNYYHCTHNTAGHSATQPTLFKKLDNAG